MPNKLISFKDLVVVDNLPGMGEYINYQSQKRKRGHFDTQGESFGESKNTPNDGNPCWDTHKKVGTKMKNGKRVNDCVPKEEVEQVEEGYLGAQGEKGRDYRNAGTFSKSDAYSHAKKHNGVVHKDPSGKYLVKHGRGKNVSEEVEQVDEALTHQQRVKASIRMKKMKSRIKMGRDRAAKRTPTMDVVKKRAFRKARLAVLKKMTKGQGKDELSFSRRADIEKKLEKKSALIQRLAKKLIPDVRKKDRERRAAK